METKVLDLPEQEYMLPGNRACSGCGLAIAYRYVLKALEGSAIITIPASCLTVLHGMYPTASVRIPCMNSAFPGTAAAASGIVAGLKALKRTDITVVGFAGDGGTYDIGIQGLSGAAERNTDFIYICYDNEAYMNTGTQRSGSTPLGVATATTPVFGKQQHAKDMPRIMESHNVPYIATACSSYPADLYDKVKKAKDKCGCTRYIHISTPCAPGWVFPTSETVKIGKMAVESGVVVLYEIEDGKFYLTGKSKTMAESNTRPKPLSDYFKAQGRFARTAQEHLDELQRVVDRRWEECLKRAAT